MSITRPGACNKLGGTDFVPIHTFRGWNDPAGEIDMSPDTAKHRVWRFVSPPENYVQMAEIMFYRKSDPVPNREGKIIGTPGTRIDKTEHQKKAMFDGDPFTFFDAPTPATAGPESISESLSRSTASRTFTGATTTTSGSGIPTSCSTGKTRKDGLRWAGKKPGTSN